MASSEVLSQTLHSITNVKLDQLAKQKTSYETAKDKLINDASTQPNARLRAKVLAEGAEKLPTMNKLTESRTISLKDLQHLIQQAELDPTVTSEAVDEFEKSLRNELEINSEKYRFAELYGKLVKEWISSGKQQPKEKDGEDDESTTTDDGSEFVPVGRAAMHEQRALWENLVFEAKETDTTAIKNYLQSLFRPEGAPTKDVSEAYNTLKVEMDTFQKRWEEETHFTQDELKNCINGLLRSDLLNARKRGTLNDFLHNKVVLDEIADVLNMRMSTRSTWTWDDECVIEPRRNLNGRYRFYPDEDLLQSIFLFYIGRRWGVEMRQMLLTFTQKHRVLKPSNKPVSKEDAERRDFFLGHASSHSSHIGPNYSFEGKLQEHFKDDVFLDQLPITTTEQRGGGYGYENDSDDGDNETEKRDSHTQVVQRLLRMLQSYITLQTATGKDVTVIRSDFKWFGPSLPHASLFAVLEFFGVNAEWISFFRQTLECPLRFAEDEEGTAKARKRGIALSTPMADFLAESMLFCLDFAVNQKADGTRLYRLHDDMWMWDSSDKCVAAWKVIGEFTELFGLELNMEKTGSVTIPSSAADDHRNSQFFLAQQQEETGTSELPEGDITWGFLTLDRAKGRFVLDETRIDEHIAELRLQLDACKNVFDWIQAWNIYGCRFFTTNFGSPATCFGREHIESILHAFHRIQKTLFPDRPGGAGGEVKAMLAERFGIDDVPDGYLYLPVKLGGLGLLNPFVAQYMSLREMLDSPKKIIDRYFEHEEADYQRAKEHFESPFDDRYGKNKMGRRPHDLERFSKFEGELFMTREEFCRYRERTSSSFRLAFDQLLEEPQGMSPDNNDPVAMDRLEFLDLTDYEQWICQQHSRDMVRRFGGLSIIDQGLLPMGMMGMLRQSRFQWQG